MALLLTVIRTTRGEMSRLRTSERRKDDQLYAHHDRMKSRMDSQVEKMGATVDVFEEKLNEMDTMDLEGNRENSEAIVEQQYAPKEETAIKNIGALVDK